MAKGGSEIAVAPNALDIDLGVEGGVGQVAQCQEDAGEDRRAVAGPR